jgi:hypothetical protein
MFNMQTAILVLIIMLVTRGEAKEDIENMVKEMNERLALTEENLKQTQGELLELKTENVQLKMDVSFLKNPPFFHACGAHFNRLSISGQTIPYTSLLPYPSTNTEGDLDISTGIFTCDAPGSYTVTWSLVAVDYAGDSQVEIYLRKNGEKITESLHVSWYSGSSGRVNDQGKHITQNYNNNILYITGGRTLVLHLDRGDTLDLYCQDCSRGIYYTTFCVSLSTFDIE